MRNHISAHVFSQKDKSETGGTGLSTVLMGPANTGSYGISPYDQFSYREVTTAYPNINVDQVVKTKTMFPSGTNFTKWVAMWRGKLIVPETGTYHIYFRKEQDVDALRFALDGQTIHSNASPYAKKVMIVTNTLDLVAGTYRAASPRSGRKAPRGVISPHR